MEDIDGSHCCCSSASHFFKHLGQSCAIYLNFEVFRWFISQEKSGQARINEMAAMEWYASFWLFSERPKQRLPSRETNMSHLGKRKIIDSKCRGRGYISSLEGTPLKKCAYWLLLWFWSLSDDHHIQWFETHSNSMHRVFNICLCTHMYIAICA